MKTRNLANINNIEKNIKQYLDDTIKTLVTKHDIVKLKCFIEEQSCRIKFLTSKITTFEQQVNSSEASTSKINVTIGSVEEKFKKIWNSRL